MYKKILKLLALLSFYSLIILGVLEVGLRLLGYKPFRPVSNINYTNHREFDSSLSWKLLPGHYEVGPFNDVGDSMSITIKKDTGRVTRMNNIGVGEKQVTFIGGSFFMGHALDDDETMAWKIQQRFPPIDFRNLAVSGYGGLQSLMVLERELKKGNKPECVIYGAFQHHELRNVGQGAWLMELRRKVPYATLKSDNRFERKGLIGMRNLRLTKRLALMFQAEKGFNNLLSYQRVKNARKLSHLIIQEMQRLCLEYQVAFYVAPLQYDSKAMKDLTSFMNTNEISYIDCNVPLTLDNIIKDDGHPGESVHKEWAKRIENRLVDNGLLK